MTKVKIFKDLIVLCAPTQSVVFKRIFKDGKELFLVKTTKCKYNEGNHEFNYDDLTSPTWLDRPQAEFFLKALQRLVEKEVRSDGR